MTSLAQTLALFLTTALALPASAGQQGEQSPVKIAELSARLFDTGVGMGDPLLILSAAKLRKTLHPVVTERSAEDGETAEDGPLGWQEMLAAAEPLAEGDDGLLGLIDDIRAETVKGVASGPVYNIGQIGGGATDRYPSIDFTGGEYAEVYVEARGQADLNLQIIDAQGRLVCSDTDTSHIAYCGWRPASTAGFRIVIENRSSTGVRYALMTN